LEWQTLRFTINKLATAKKHGKMKNIIATKNYAYSNSVFTTQEIGTTTILIKTRKIKNEYPKNKTAKYPVHHSTLAKLE
jgi:hypothetical protein